MKVKLETNLKSFLEEVAPVLTKDSSLHSMILSLANRYLELGKPMYRLVRVLTDDDRFLGAGIQTDPERALIISKILASHVREFAEKLAAKIVDLPGVNGPKETIDIFSDVWCQVRNCRAELVMNLRLFELTKVIETKSPGGAFRIATRSDREVLFQWMRAFHQEAVPHDPLQSDADLYNDIDSSTQLGQYFVWEKDQKCVCMVASKRETQTERWIAPVYTPKEYRGQGFGSALVAEVSKVILVSGKKAMLFTDLANPTSNSIYQKVGYQPISDFKYFIFSKA